MTVATTKSTGFFAFLENLWNSDVEPFFGGIVSSEVAAVEPIAAQALTTLTTEETAALLAGGKTTGNVLASVTAKTVSAMEVAGITAAAPSILTAVGNATAKLAPPATS